MFNCKQYYFSHWKIETLYTIWIYQNVKDLLKHNGVFLCDNYIVSILFCMFEKIICKNGRFYHVHWMKNDNWTRTNVTIIKNTVLSRKHKVSYSKHCITFLLYICKMLPLINKEGYIGLMYRCLYKPISRRGDKVVSMVRSENKYPIKNKRLMSKTKIKWANVVDGLMNIRMKIRKRFQNL